MEIPASIHRNFIRRGVILHSEIFEEIDHGKFFAIIGVSGNVVAGFFFINSRIHRSILNKPAQLSMQYLLHRKDYDFLDYDSYLCATFIQKISVDRLAETLATGQTIYKGELTKADLASVLESCRASKLFSKNDKASFFSDQ